MIEIIAILAVVILFGSTVWYTPLLWKGAIKPAPATWIIGAVALNISMLSYLDAADGTFLEKILGNVMLFGAAIELTFICGVLLWSLHRQGGLKVAFDRLQQGFFVVMFVSLIPWAYNRENAGVTFWTTQILFVVAYFATVSKVRKIGKNIDSLVHWTAIFVASALGGIPATAMDNLYGEINSIRAVGSAGLLLILLLRHDRKNGWAQWRREFGVWKNFFNNFGIVPERSR